MTKFVYIGQEPRAYPDILVPDGDNPPKVLVALPGDVCEFDVPPTDGLWVQSPEAPEAVSKPSAPAKPAKVKE